MNITFENHVNSICKRASQKLNSLSRVAPYMNMQKRRIVMKSFVTSQFGYCPLIWIFDSRYYNNKTNFIQESAVNIIYQGHIFTFHKLLNNDNSVSMHHRNLQVLAAEMIECHKGLPPDILRETFVLKKRWYNLRRSNTF